MSTINSAAEESDANGSGSVSEDETLHSQGVTESTVTAQASSSQDQRAETRSTKSTSSKKSESKAGDDKSESSSASNLVGKINNLVTTDLGNIVDSRDFLYMVLYIPLQITLCMVFLYLILGWRCVDTVLEPRGRLLTLLQFFRWIGCHDPAVPSPRICCEAGARRPSYSSQEDRRSSRNRLRKCVFSVLFDYYAQLSLLSSHERHSHAQVVWMGKENEREDC